MTIDTANAGPLFDRMWTLCLLEQATIVGIAPATRDVLFALAYFANCAADAFDAPASQSVLIKQEGGPQYPRVVENLDRLVGTGLAKVSNVVSTMGLRKMSVQYFAASRATDLLNEICSDSVAFSLMRNFHRFSAISFGELGIGNLIAGARAEASYSDAAVGFGDLINLGEFGSAFPTQVAIAAIVDVFKQSKSRSTYAAIQAYGKFLSHTVEAQSGTARISIHSN